MMATSKNSSIPIRSLTAVIYLSMVTAPICGQTLHHWRFEDGQFLDDSVGLATLVGTMTDQVSLPADGAGKRLPAWIRRRHCQRVGRQVPGSIKRLGCCQFDAGYRKFHDRAVYAHRRSVSPKY